MKNRTMKMGAFVMAGALSLCALSACGSNTAGGDEGHVYFLSGKPEVVDQFQTLADEYGKETGVDVEFQSATAGDYESTLSSELAKSNPPTMFILGGFNHFAKFKDYLLPLQDSEEYSLLNDEGKANALKEGDDVYSLPFVAEWYGIIYNKKIIREYASKDYAVIDSDKDIVNYDTLKSVMDDIQKHKDDLGLDGAVASPGLDPSDDYRFSAHMSRLPIFYEYKDAGVTFEPEIKGTYLDNYKSLFDTEVNDSPTQASMLSTKTYEDVTSEFSLGKVAFYPNGVWAYSQIKGNDVDDKDLGMLPYYMGIPGEEDYGPGSAYDNAFAINKKASKKDQEASLAFIKWMVSSDKGRESLSKDMGFSVPFTTFDNDKYQPDNPLTKESRAYEKEGKPSVTGFTQPGQAWRDGIAAALVEYVQGTGDWSGVKKAFVGGWKTEWQNYKTKMGMVPQAQKFE